LSKKSKLTANSNGRHSYLADFFEEQLLPPLAVEGRKPVFTHSDLQRKNILVEKVSGSDGKTDYRVWLVDWEASGWYPVYWEYFNAFLGFSWDDDWCSKVVQAVDAWPAETAMLKMISRTYGCDLGI
jgi:thiamine kinase-like enzyme